MRPCWGGAALRIIDWLLPIGTVISNSNSTFDPNKIYKNQTWERYAKGRALVGVDEGQAEFNSANKTGGEKTHRLTIAEMPGHTHSRNYYSSDFCAAGTRSAYHGSSDHGEPKTTGSTGGNGSHNNLQPYVTVYYWRRIA